MPNNGSVTGEIDSVDGEYTIPMGFHDGSGKVGIADTEAEKIVAGNIKAGVEILGVTGTYGGEEISAQAKTVTPRTTQQTVHTVTISVVPYAAPRFNSYSTQRCTSAGASSSNGTYAKSTVGFSYWSCSGKNTITTAVAYKKSSESSYTNAGVSFTSGTQFIFGGGNLSVDYSYDIRFTLTDAFGAVTVVDSLSTASVLMDFKAGGTGLAVGKVSETDSCFEVSENWDV